MPVIKYNYNDDTMTLDGVVYDLKSYRKWLISNHEQLCQGHFIKAITVGGKTKFTYDWQSIYAISETYNFIKDYERTTRETQS